MAARIVVVGGGIVGLATGLALTRKIPGARVVLLEKEADVARHQSTHNSGVLHCGLAYRPGSLKARLSVAGIRAMIAFCRENEIRHEVCGKLVVATKPEDLPRLDRLEQNGRENGLEGLERLDAAGIRAREPHVVGLEGLLVPEEGIVDYAAVTQRMAERLREAGGEIVTSARVVALERRGGEWVARTAAGDERSGELLVTCAGLHSDRVAALAGERPAVRIVPFRGEYHRLRPERRELVRHLVYPVPDPAFPFLGVHFTRHVDGEVEAGPNAVLAFSREGYRARDVDLGDLGDSLFYPGLWRFLARYPRMVATELGGSLSRELFRRALARLVPEIRSDDLVAGGSGVRAQAMRPTGELVQDFELVAGERSLHVVNAPSPAATASLAIGEEIAGRLVG